MADPNGFKLFRTVDPTTVNVPIKEKFAKLTLSSNKKQQLASKTPQQKPLSEPQSTRSNSNVSRQLLGELNDIAAVKSYEHPLLRSDSSSSHTMGQEHTPKAEDARSQIDVSDYMEALQMSADGCTQQTVDVDVEALSTQVSNLTMQPEERLPQEQSICISSTTAESDDDDDGSASCITISDSSESEHEQQEAAQNEPEPTSMTVSEQLPPTSIPDLSNVKVQRIEAFLRDVSFERREIIRRGSVDMLGDITRLASADTESMSLGEIDCTELLSVSQHQADSSKRLADNETEINTMCSVEQVDSSKRLADNETEVNTVCSEDDSKRLANDDTEVNTPNLEEPLSDISGQQTTLDETIPETSSELEQTPPRPTSASSAEPEELEHTPAIQVSSINISAKINIKIQIPTMDSSSEAEQSIVETAVTSEEGAELCRQQEQEKERDREQDGGQEEELDREQERECSVLGSDASEDEQFLTQAEKLLNQLYGKSWQTPDVIRTLKRSSGSGGKTPSVGTGRRAPLTEIKRKPRQPIATPAEKAASRTTAQANDSAVGDFSIFRRALNSNRFNSTHLPTATCSERRPNRPRVRTKHIDEERWRALVDTDSGTDASDDDDANATESSEDSEDEDGDEAKSDGRVIYLDLTKNEAEAFGSPDEPKNTKSPTSPKRLGALEDILRTCRATTKSKLPATPTTTTTPVNPIRRQLFTPNTGYEDPTEAKRIVDQALDLNSLDQLEIIYLPGSNVHKRIQEVKKQLGIGVQTPKAKPIFNLPTPKTAPPTRTMVRARQVMKNKNSKKSPPRGPYGFLKSLEPEVSRELSDQTALFYRENFPKNKERLALELYKMYNAKVFNSQLDVSIVWSARLRNTAGRCNNKRRMRMRSSVIELSIKVLTSADRLRCTLIHELCHAAAWIFNGAGGHGAVWRSWADRALSKFPELPPISVCHQYKIEYKFTYKCEACNMSLNAHSKSRKVDQYCCQYCQGPIVLYRNKKTKLGGVVQTPVREATGFAKYVKDNFNKHKSENLTAVQVMRILSAEYAKEKNGTKDNAESNDVAEQMDTLILDSD